MSILRIGVTMMEMGYPMATKCIEVGEPASSVMRGETGRIPVCLQTKAGVAWPEAVLKDLLRLSKELWLTPVQALDKMLLGIKACSAVRQAGQVPKLRRVSDRSFLVGVQAKLVIGEGGHSYLARTRLGDGKEEGAPMKT